jgi:hypothetical protein
MLVCSSPKLVIKAEKDLPGTEGGRGARAGGGRNDPMYAHVNK